MELENGYLTISASKGLDKDEQDKKGKYIRQERYAGAMQRSFYVGDGVSQEDVDEAADALNQAIDALQEKGQPQQSGDVNGDGKVNSSDARLVLQYTVELIPLTEEQLARANMNGDGLVNSSDARLILQATVELATLPE